MDWTGLFIACGIFAAYGLGINLGMHIQRKRSAIKPQDYTLVRTGVLRWLLGEEAHPDTGLWFERPIGDPPFWWRKYLRSAMLAAGEAPRHDDTH